MLFKLNFVGELGELTVQTLAKEGIGGFFHLADFEALTLDSFNRNTGKISEMGLNKAIHVARDLVELDPFLKVVPFQSKLTKGNIFSFIQDQGNPLDLIMEHCSLPEPEAMKELKFLLREHAKISKIPLLGVRG